jgi:riboflavin kinase/FMN adenylyltransferase
LKKITANSQLVFIPFHIFISTTFAAAVLKTYNSISDFSAAKKTIATLGTFDGVHKGHRKIIKRIVESAAANDCQSVILTFFPHPRMVLQQDSDVRLLNTIDERAMLLGETGLDSLIIHPFDEAFSRLSAEEFVKTVLVEQLNIRKIIIGHDHRFGKGRTANIQDLILFGKKYEFEVEQISAQEVDHVAVSSTKIRTALNQGNIELANEYLGYHYFITGTVVRGKQLGRTIGFPTANISITDSYKQIPAIGVYVVTAQLNDAEVFGMMNIGRNPTIGDNALSIEVYFFNFDNDLYDKKLAVSILFRMRDEEKFPSVALLKEQLKADQAHALQLLTSNGYIF